MRWSYKTVHYTLKKEGLLGSTFLDESEIEMSLNEYGKGGWELVNMIDSMEGVTAVFKQPIEGVDNFMPQSFAKPVAKSAKNAVPQIASSTEQTAKDEETAQPQAKSAQRSQAAQAATKRAAVIAKATARPIAKEAGKPLSATRQQSAAHLDSLFDNPDVAEAIFEIVEEDEMDELIGKPQSTAENKTKQRVLKRGGIYGLSRGSGFGGGRMNSDIGSIRIQ